MIISFRRYLTGILTILLLLSPQTQVWARSRGRIGGSVGVRGHITRRGTYVSPHRRSAPDRSRWNNWSTKGNVNPYTGKPGTKIPR